MDHARRHMVDRFAKSHDGLGQFSESLMAMMEQIEAVTDQIKIQTSKSEALQRLNRQLWTTQEEVTALSRMVLTAEMDMEHARMMIEEEDLPLEVLEEENVFRPEWMVFEAVEVEDV